MDSQRQKSVNCWKKHVGQRLPLFRHRWPKVARWVSLVVGALVGAVGASPNTITVWQTSLRFKINQTETESNIMAQFGTVGLMLGIVPGITYEYFGSQFNAIVAGVLSTSTYTIMGLACSKWQAFFSNNMWVTYIVCFFLGMSSMFFYMCSMMPNIHNFPFKHRGTVIGILDAILSVGPTILSVIYNTLFTNGYVNPGEEGLQNLSGFFFFVALLSGAVAIIDFFFVGRLDQVEESVTEEIAAIIEEDELDLANDDSRMAAIEPHPPNDYSEFPFAEVRVPRLFLKADYYLFLLHFVLCAASQLTFNINISTYLKSFSMSQYNLLFTSLNTTSQAVAKLVAGIASDYIAHRNQAPRAVVVLGPYALQTIMFAISMFYGDSFTVLLITCIVTGIGYGAIWCQSPTLLGELFGGKYLASNWGWTLLFCGIAGFPYSLSFSAIYQAYITVPGDTYCNGLQCFRWSFAIFAASGLCAFIMALGLTQNMYRNASDRRKLRERLLGPQTINTSVEYSKPDRDSEEM